MVDGASLIVFVYLGKEQGKLQWGLGVVPQPTPCESSRARDWDSRLKLSTAFEMHLLIYRSELRKDNREDDICDDICRAYQNRHKRWPELLGWEVEEERGCLPVRRLA